MTREQSSNHDITDSKILRVQVPQPLIEPFQIADHFTQRQFYLVGSSVSRCILGEFKFPNDVDFLGTFDLDRIEAHFGSRVLGKSNPSGIMKVLQGGQEIDFLSFPDIRGKLETMDITISLLCMDKNGFVYDPLNYIDDLRNRIIRRKCRSKNSNRTMAYYTGLEICCFIGI